MRYLLVATAVAAIVFFLGYLYNRSFDENGFNLTDTPDRHDDPI